jgi:tRNA(His) 5'-end guanylyltransferase
MKRFDELHVLQHAGMGGADCGKFSSAKPTFDPQLSHHHDGQIIASKASQLTQYIHWMILDAWKEV